MSAKIKEKLDASVEGKLKTLYQLQLIDSKIDRLQTIRGELPLEVSDLEDTVTGLQTRLQNVTEEVAHPTDQEPPAAFQRQRPGGIQKRSRDPQAHGLHPHRRRPRRTRRVFL